MGNKMVGFEADIKSIKEIKVANILETLQTDDLVKFGLIPEFAGRLPAVGVLHELDKNTLKDILTKPKNALVKQYKQLFMLEDVELEFQVDALEEIAQSALRKESGARGLRFVLEKIMLDLMYNVPSEFGISKVIITRGMVKGEQKAKIIYDKEEKTA